MAAAAAASDPSAAAVGGHDGELFDKSILEFATYEDYIDQHVTPEDLFYLEDPDAARQIVELGYKGKDFMSREEFEAAKKAAVDGPLRRKRSLDALCSGDKDLSEYPFLYALAQREELVRNGKLSTIIFIRDVIDARGHEVSGYVDFGHRLKTEGDDFEDYFLHKRKLLPKPTDLSYYNWRTQTLSYSNSSTFQVIADNEVGLVFKHKRDRKTICVDPRALSPGDNTHRVVLKTTEYTQVVLYDHVTRRKN
eukprot:TRINITY_DN1953_c0_g1_i1.p1 TRINITY_DN1953_c0_g1~~TRINITY_DN1953_c0_g1_i1.p1  ORF type:complete len:251 (-),score=43.13 TRINITY_DN1953_c0_g1_i1:337-1089(-)